MANSKNKGDRSEEEAFHWLVSHQVAFRLLHRNYRCKVGEIDLILEQDVYASNGTQSTELVFVEVRSRQTDSGQVSALESITFRKKWKVERAAQFFLITYHGPATSIRFDVVAWEFGQTQPIYLREAW